MKIKKICVMLTAIAVLVCTMGIAANAAEYRTISFTDDAQSSDWVILNGMTKKSLTDGIWKGWYSADGMGSEMIFCFDGSKSKTIGDTVYDMNGIPSMLQFCVMSFGNGSISTSEVFVSEDNVEYTSVGMLQSFLNWGDKSLYQDAAGLTYWGGPTFASYTPIRITENSLPSYARFVKIQINKNVGSVGICKPTVTYKQELNGFDVENARAVTEENEITLVFNDVPDSSTLTADSLRVYAKESQEEVPINGILAEGKKVTIVFDEKLSRKTVYVVEADESVCMENGSALDFFTAEFTTVGGYEEIVYIDDRSGEMFMKTDNVSTNHDMVKDSIALRGKYPKASWIFAFDGSMVKTQEGETYTFDGMPTEFIIYYYHFGNYDINNMKFYVSEDNVNFTEAVWSSVTGAPSSAASWIISGGAELKNIPDGTKYIKIEAANISAENNFLMLPGIISYTVGSGKTTAKSSFDYAAEKTTVTIGTYADIKEKDIRESAFSIDGVTPVSAALGEDKRTITLEFNGLLDFDTAYRVEINGLSNVNGTAMRGCGFTTEKRPELLSIDAKCMQNDVVLTELANGTVSVNADITFNYHDDYRQSPVTMAVFVYNGDRITQRAYETKTLSVGETQTFAKDISITDKDNEKIYVMVWKTVNEFIPLADEVKLFE